MQALQTNSTLQGGKYRIIKKLGQGGFGITYLAENTMLEGKVAIKEFFFKDYCERDNATRHVTISTSGNREIVERFKQKFIKDARTIFKLNHQNIVCIHDVFEENGTAYYVMDYIEGESLGDMVKRRGAIPEAEAAGYDVTFTCNVPSALLLIDGVQSGTASGTRFLKTGSHSIQVTAERYVDYSGTFAVNSSSRSINITLQEVPNGFSNGVLTIKGVSYDMVWVEGGTFCMGATSEQGLDSVSDEWPVHSVTLSGYYIGKTEVTQALWKAVMGSNPSWFKGDNLPVENVSWNDCQEFIRKLNDLTGQNFRLPTEAEWEFACRGGINSGGYRYSGSDYIDDVAWYDDNSRETTHPVAKKLPNELGIYDMSGNVWEWCNDWYGFYCSGAQINPKGPCDGLNRVYRGGSWGYYGWCCRSSLRNCDSPGYHSVYLGLRLAL